ncbi:hypothetical protein [Clostridium manihotivorum]|uniref:Uncharacterized protein n=1 Tax=Clostridium manihotivorum TaxID=2320868 RepID=A0A3R5V875_9CLOT|nr:hypothetical protein [Clostridium manihotivorum]QAA32389.1 hypothetical protein C1I91_12475 [Clostridium manihotivorum]
MKLKFVFLGIFIFAIILIFNITNFMLEEGFSSTIGMMQAADKRFAYSLVALFSLVGYFVEVILERIKKN